MPTMITGQTETPSDRPVNTMSVNTMTSSTGSTNVYTNDTDRPPTVQTTAADASTMTDVNSASLNPMSTNPSMPDKPDTTMTENQHGTSSSSSTFSGGNVPTTNMYPNTIDSTKMPAGPSTMITTTMDRFPTTMDRFPTTMDRFPTTMDRFPTTTMDRFPTTTMDRFPTTSTTYGGGSSDAGSDMPTNPDLTTNEVKPPTYPTIYMSSTKPDDFNYPYPPQYQNKYNYYHEIYPVYSTYPMLYDTNYMPSSGSSGNGGGSGGGGYAQNIPTLSYHPNVEIYGTTPTMAAPEHGSTYGSTRIPNTATTYMGNGWSNADEVIRRKQNGAKYPNPDRDNSGYNPEGKYNGTRTPPTVPYIRTYFNPDDYITNAEAKREYKSASMMIPFHIKSK